MSPLDETVETAAWNNRQLMLKIYYQVVETNGTVKDHTRCLFGDDRGTVGLVKQVVENTQHRERASVAVKVLAVVGSTVGVLLTTMLVYILNQL